jgi:hypothetical protein
MSALEDLNDALALVDFHFGPPPERPQTWRWREESFGVCQRCYWDCHTLGPDGRAWHAFCWDNPTSPTRYDQWALRRWREEHGNG